MSFDKRNPVLIDFPDPSSNVFLMMRFRDRPQYEEIYKSILSDLAEYSLNLLRADSKQYMPELWSNTKCYMDASQYGIAVFEQIDERDINPNISLELGYMLGQGKKCLLLKEMRVPSLNADLVGHLYKTFDSFDIEKTLKTKVEDWIKLDLGFNKKAGERLIIFVSNGGTCRCAMAKAITRKLVSGKRLNYELRVESFAYGQVSGGRASFNAMKTIRNMYNENLLEDHIPKKLNQNTIREADLILVMSQSLLKGLPPEKTRVLKPFLGCEGDLLDPWPDTEDRIHHYERCAKELKEILEGKMDSLIKSLETRDSIPDTI